MIEPKLLEMMHEIHRSNNDLREDIRSSREELSTEMSALRRDMTALRKDFEEALGGDFRTAKDGLVAKVERAQKSSDEVLSRLTAVEAELTDHRERRGALKEQMDNLSVRLTAREAASQSLFREVQKSLVATTVPVLLLSLLVGAWMLLRSRLS